MGLKKNLLFVIPSLAGGGAERTLVHVLNHLDASDYDITVVLFEDVTTYKNTVRFPARWIQLGKRSKWDVFKVFLRLKRTIARVSPDTVVASLYYANILATVAVLVSRNRPRTVLCEHSDPRRYTPFYRLLIRLTYRHADAVVPVSRTIGRVLSDRFGVEPSRTRVIHNPVPIDSIEAGTGERDADHPFLAANANGPVVAGMGRLIPIKRFDRLLEAFAVLHDTHPDSRLLILGDGPLREQLEALALELKVRDATHFAGFQSNPYAWISKADLFVLSSDIEGFPMAILEAMAVGTCVVSTDTPSGPREIIEDRVNGRLVPRGVEALAEAMCELAEDKDLARELARNARQTVQQYRVEAVAPRYREVF